MSTEPLLSHSDYLDKMYKIYKKNKHDFTKDHVVKYETKRNYKPGANLMFRSPTDNVITRHFELLRLIIFMEILSNNKIKRDYLEFLIILLQMFEEEGLGRIYNIEPDLSEHTREQKKHDNYILIEEPKKLAENLRKCKDYTLFENRDKFNNKYPLSISNINIYNYLKTMLPKSLSEPSETSQPPEPLETLESPQSPETLEPKSKRQKTSEGIKKRTKKKKKKKKKQKGGKNTKKKNIKQKNKKTKKQK